MKINDMALKIKEAITSHGLTINEVASRMGINRVGLYHHINGNPSASVLERIAEAIGCSVGELFTDEPESAKSGLKCPYCGHDLHVHID